ncbi:zinc-ribbon domain-containing protein [Geobacter pelophilus]|uniref:Zinc-ribbon domain-containing protein n=1 Tax=Geoanaerobacter pelophilus TaxID=60036 RepID=A0AAW4L5J1_9BACT|nr:zinc-ribbon domain-containing protein [Geoanaerobacter pelophilus]MBT0665432.1 zinc-ribbon domain-containing protein [Geoanaerobacter pelophilus]
MKIECPNCKLSGEVNDHEVPLDGRYIDCPRCKTGFQVKKPLAKGWNPNMMSACPACQYSTFTDEMFDVCPKCGLQGSVYHEKKRKQQEEEQGRRDMERLNASLRPDDFVKPPVKEVDSDIVRVAPLVRYTAIGTLAVACLVAFYGLVGLLGYDGDALLQKINETALEPVSKNEVFLSHGLLPLVLTLFGGSMAMLSGMLLKNGKRAIKGLELGAWAGLAIGVVYEVVDYIAYIRRSSESPSIAYCLVGLVNSVFMLAVWVSVPLGLIWWLRSDRFRDELDSD